MTTSSFHTTPYAKVAKGIAYINIVAKNKFYAEDPEKHRWKKTLPVGMQIQSVLWAGGKKAQWILGNDSDTMEKNRMIKKTCERLEEFYLLLRRQLQREPYASEVVHAFQTDVATVDRPRYMLMAFIKQYVTDKKLEGPAAEAYLENLNGVLKTFLKQKYNAEDYYVDQIDSTFLYRFELYMTHAISRKGKPYAPSSVLKYVEKMRALKAHAQKIGEIKADNIAGYVPNAMIAPEKKQKEVIPTLQEAVFWKIPPDQLHKIETLQVQGYAVRGETETATGNQYNYDLVRVRLIFLLQTWTGFAYGDLVQKKDLKQYIRLDLSGKKSVIYHRSKNQELAILPFFEQAERLMEALEYNAQPLCSYDTFNRKIKALLRYYNIAQPEETVTHLGRHLFGSRMLSIGFTMEAISRMMGHESIKMTESVYARIDLTKVQADYDKIQLLSTELGNRIAI